MKAIKLLYSIVSLFYIAALAQSDLPFGPDKNKIDVSKVPDCYEFTWKYTMEMQSEKEKSVTADYLLTSGADYFGMKFADDGMFMIMDMKNRITVTAFAQGKDQMASVAKMPDYAAMAEKKSLGHFIYKVLSDKTVLGYHCKGFEATNSEYTMVFYFTNDAPVNFADMFKSPQTQKLPDAFSNYFKPGDKPLMMSVDIRDNKKGRSTSMKCVALEKSEETFKKSDYTFM